MKRVPPLKLGSVNFFVFSLKFLQVLAKNEGRTRNITHCVSLLSLQCQDLPGSQSSSPLSQMESYTGRSMDPLLPAGEAGRKKVRDTDYDVSQRHHSERHRSHVSLGFSVFLQQCFMTYGMWGSGFIGPLPVLWWLYFSFRTSMKNGIGSPVWHWGRPVWQRRTPQSRAGTISLKNSSLNPAPTKPVYVHHFPLPTWCGDF